MPNTTVNPLALPAGDAIRMLRRSGCPQMSDETLQRLIDGGLPLNADGTLNIIEYTAWLQEVNALLFSGYPGDEASQVIADILFGEVNPSGHLPFKIKFNKNCSDLSFLDHLQPIETKIEKIKKDELKFNEVVSAVSFGKIKDQDMKRYNYSKGLTFDKRLLLKKATIFHFGYGLSYSSFDYTDLKPSLLIESFKSV